MEDVDDTLTFLELIVMFWKIPNVNGLYDNVCFCNPLKCPIRAADSTNLNDLIFLANFFKKMAPSSYHRKILAKDTSKSLVHTFHYLVDLEIYMISVKNFSYVILRQFASDHLEKEFFKFRQGSGVTCFIQPSKC